MRRERLKPLCGYCSRRKRGGQMRSFVIRPRCDKVDRIPRHGGELPMTTEAATPKDRIKQELVRQIGERGYRAITITALASALGMSRQNLYKHYTSKEEIFLDLTQDRLEAFFDVFEVFYADRSPDKWPLVIRNVLAVVEDNRNLIQALLADDTGPVVFDSLNAAVRRALGHVARVNAIAIDDAAYFNIIALHITGATFHAARSWVLEGMSVSAEKMALVFADIFNDGIVAKLRQCAHP